MELNIPTELNKALIVKALDGLEVLSQGVDRHKNYFVLTKKAAINQHVTESFDIVRFHLVEGKTTLTGFIENKTAVEALKELLVAFTELS